MTTILLASLSLAVGELGADRTLVDLLLRMDAAYAPVASYTARFTREETVGGQRRPPEDIFLKFRRPGSLYMRWISGPAVGREILYVPGEHGSRALLHEPGFLSGLFTVVLAPDSPLVLRHSRHPIDRAGIGPLVELVTANVRRGLAEQAISLIDRGVHAIEERRTQRVEILAPADSGSGYYAPRVVVDVDREWNLPVGVAVFDATDRLIERYAYAEIQLDPGLTDRDFRPDHPDYRFPRLKVSR